MVTTPKIRPPSGRLITPFRQGVTPHIMAPFTGGTPDTFILPRRQVLWPQLATSSVGTWGWTSDAACVFGGYWFNSSGALNDRLNFENVALFSGPVKLNVLHTTAGGGGVVSVYWGNDKLGEFDNRTSSVTRNSVLLNLDLGTVSAGRKQLSFRIEGTTGSGYSLRIQQLEIIQPTGTNLGTSIDDLPWFGDIPPICYSAASAAPSLTQNTAGQWGSYLTTPFTPGNWIEYQAWLPQGSVNLDVVYITGSNRGISTVSLNGVEQGEWDSYNLGSFLNQKATVALSVPYTGMHTIRFTQSTKNDESSYYYLTHQWISWRKTAETGAIAPTGTTYGVGSRELWPWFAENSDWNVFQLASNRLHYATMYNSSTAINDSQEWTHSLLPGTYGLITVGRRSGDYGNAHWSENGGPDLDIINHAGAADGAYRFTGSLALLGGTLKRSVDSSSGTPANYYLNDTMIRLARTGD